MIFGGHAEFDHSKKKLNFTLELKLLHLKVFPTCLYRETMYLYICNVYDHVLYCYMNGHGHVHV